MTPKPPFQLVLIALLAMASTTIAAQDRMPPLAENALTDAQARALADFTAARGAPTGPWIALLRSPEVMTRARALSDYLRFSSSLPPRLSELVILLMAREWAQNYIWNTHIELAKRGGLNTEVAEAIAKGYRPPNLAADEAVIYDFFTEVSRNRSVSDATYARAIAMFGEQGVIEITSLMGYYTLIAMVLNVARAPLPDGAEPALAPLP